jgi:hypothetical protein
MNRDLKPFERRYTPEQRRAIVHAILDARPPLKVPEAVKRAAAGTLPGSELEPFGSEQLPDGAWKPVSEQTVYAWKRRELAERGVKANGRLAKAETSGEALRIVLATAWSDVEKAREAASRQKLSPADQLRLTREYVATARAIHDAERSLQGKPPKAGATEPEKPGKSKQGDEASALAKAARERSKAEHHDAQHTTTSQGAGTDTGTGSTDEQQHDASHSVARVANANGHANAARPVP